MSKITKYLLYILLGISLVFIIAFFINQDAMLDSFLYYAYAMVGVALLSMIILPFINLVGNPKGLKKILLFIVMAVVLVGVSYLLASSEPLMVKINVEASEKALKLTDAGLILAYILSGCAFLAILLGGAIRTIRGR